MQAVLVMFRSDGERRSFSVTRDMTVIGRREDCDLRIPLGDISRKHARLVRDGDTLRLEDLGSSNGTYLNGQRVQEAVVSPGDSIQIGPVVFVLQIDGYPEDDALQPVIAEMVEAPAAETAPTDASPLSPTAQSELEDMGQLEPLPEYDDAGAAGLEPLQMDDMIEAPTSAEALDLELLPELPSAEDALNLAPLPPPKLAPTKVAPGKAAPARSAAARPAPKRAAPPPPPPPQADGIGDDLDLSALPDLDDESTLELLPDEHHLDSPHQPRH